MNDEGKSGTRDVYWDSELRTKWLKMPFTKLRKSKERRTFQVLTYVKILLNVVWGSWENWKVSFGPVKSIMPVRHPSGCVE